MAAARSSFFPTECLQTGVLVLAIFVVFVNTDGIEISKTELPKFAESINNVTTPVSREATLTCIVDNLSAYKVAWLRVDTQTILTIATHVITKNHRIAVTHSDHRLWFLHIREVRESDRGWYMCQINTDPMLSQVGYLEVVVPPDILDYPTSTDMVVRENNNVTLQCAATGFPHPNITWKREQGQPIPLSNGQDVVFVDGPVFNITRVNRLHMGAYLCIASNGVPPSVSKRIMLIVHFPPMISVPNQLVGAQEGQSMTLECHSEAFPKSINYWTKNNDTIAQGGKYEPVLIDNAYKVQMKLTIKSVQASDFGTYKCVSRNSLGETDGTIKLYPIIPSTTSHKPSTTTEVIVPPPEKEKKPKQKQREKDREKSREKNRDRRPVNVDIVNEVVPGSETSPSKKAEVQLRSEEGGRLQARSEAAQSLGEFSKIGKGVYIFCMILSIANLYF